MRMNAGAGVDPVVGLRDRNATSHLVGTGTIPDRENPANTGVPCTLNDGVTILIETRIVEVRVRINEHALLQPRAVLDFFMKSCKNRRVLRTE